MTRKIFVMLCILGFMGAIGLAAGVDTGASLLSNGKFDKDGGNNWPADWPHPEGTTWEKEGDVHFLRLRSTQPGKMIMVYRTIDLPPGVKGLELSFRERHEGIKPGSKPWFDGRIVMNFKDAQNAVLKGAPTPYFRGTGKGWEPYDVKFLVPAGAKTLEFMPSLFMADAGTLDLGDIRLTPMNDAAAEAMAGAAAAAAKLKEDRDAAALKEVDRPSITAEIKVSGNKLVTLAGEKTVWLQGLSVDSMQWSMGENILWSIKTAIDDWKANVIRLPVLETFWFGHGKGQEPGTEEEYRQLVDKAVKLVAGRGCYLVLDLHRFGAPTAEHVAFWKDAAARYKNNPAVLFELFNEPHGISWDIWRNGGDISGPKNKAGDVGPAENTQKMATNVTTGVQALVDAVRSTGARNIVIAGGLDWSYDLTGIMNGYALDDKGGNGVMYVAHIYPWKSDWKDKVLCAVNSYPVIVTEVGCSSTPMPWQKTTESPTTWAPDMIGFIQKYKLNWTAFSFNPHCGPEVISDWNYTPTPDWGVYVKEALGGQQFDLKRMR